VVPLGWRLGCALLVCASSLLAACVTHSSSTAALPPCACVDDNGNVVTTPTIVKSSGSARLDEGALRLAQSPKCKMPDQGQPVDPKNLPHCVMIRLKFEQPK